MGEPLWLQVYLKTIAGDHRSKAMSALSLENQYSYWKDRMGHLMADTDRRSHRPEWHNDQPFFNAMQATCAGRRFFSNDKGRIGIGNRQLASGDKIYVLLQAIPPFTLRSCNGGDRKHGLTTNNALIGHAYVQGLVHGEAFDLTDKGPDELINIC